MKFIKLFENYDIKYDDVCYTLEDILLELNDLGYKTLVDTYTILPYPKTIGKNKYKIVIDINRGTKSKFIETEEDYKAITDALNRIKDYMKDKFIMNDGFNGILMYKLLKGYDQEGGLHLISDKIEISFEPKNQVSTRYETFLESNKDDLKTQIDDILCDLKDDGFNYNVVFYSTFKDLSIDISCDKPRLFNFDEIENQILHLISFMSDEKYINLKYRFSYPKNTASYNKYGDNISDVKGKDIYDLFITFN